MSPAILLLVTVLPLVPLPGQTAFVVVQAPLEDVTLGEAPDVSLLVYDGAGVAQRVHPRRRRARYMAAMWSATFRVRVPSDGIVDGHATLEDPPAAVGMPVEVRP